MVSHRFAAANPGSLPPVLAQRVAAIADSMGFLPNVFAVMARRPRELQAFLDYHDALMDRDGEPTTSEREMIAVVVSASNRCSYCVVAHGAILRIRSRDARRADLVAIDHHRAGLSSRQCLMLDFALKVAHRAGAIDDEDFSSLHDAGFDEEAIWDIGAIAALFSFSNRVAQFTALQPNVEFFEFGRGR